MKKSVRIKRTKKDSLSDLFNQMLGIKDAKAYIIEPKYESFIEHGKIILMSLRIFIKSAAALRSEFSVAFGEIDKFIFELELLIKNNELAPSKEKLTTDPKVSNSDLGSKYNPKLLNFHYREIKNSEQIKAIIVTLSHIQSELKAENTRSKKILSDLDMDKYLRDDFIKNTRRAELNLFSFAGLDFKRLFLLQKTTNRLKEIILLVLHKIYISGLAIYDLTSKPDIVIDEFCKSLIERIDTLNKHVKGCDRAFDRIRKSTKMLKNNFDTYYKSFTATKQPGIIIEMFIKDVANNNKNNAIVMSQFTKLISNIKKLLPASVANNEKVRNLFTAADQVLGSKFSENKDDKGKDDKDDKGKDDKNTEND